MLASAEQIRDRGAGLRMLSRGGGGVDTCAPMGSTVFTVVGSLSEMEREIKRERMTDSLAKRCAADKGLGGCQPTFSDF